MKKISVIGSCVCRDLFEKDTENFSFYTDIRFSNPISMLSEPADSVHAGLDNFIKDVKTVNGNWYKKNLINDINKTAFDALEERHGEYLILDFAESRISLANIKWQDRSQELLVSNSVSFRAHYHASFKENIFQGTQLEIINPLEYDDAFWEKTIKDFAGNITRIFDANKIILIKNMPAEHYVDAKGYLHPYYSDDHFNSILLCKILLEKLNGYFVQFCPECKVIEIPRYAIGSQTHKWGNHPFHFTEIYYQYLLECVKAITLEENTGKLEELYRRYSAEFQKEYDQVRLKSARKKDTDNQPFSVIDLLKQYEEYNMLGKKQKTLILFALDKKHFFENFKRIVKGK